MEQKHLIAIEYDKILKVLAAATSCEDAEGMALSLEPSSDLKQCLKLLKQSDDAFVLLSRYGSPSFDGLYNVNHLLALADSGATLSIRDIRMVATTLRSIRSLSDWRSKCEGLLNSLKFLFDGLHPDKALEQRIFDVIISDEEIADDASKELSIIRKSIKRQEAKIRELLDRIIHSPNYQTVLQDNIITIRNGRFVVPVKYECKNQIAGLVQDTSSSGSTVFIEPMSVVDANNEIKVLLGREKEEIERILSELSAQISSISYQLKGSYENAVELNFIFAKAHIADSMNATCPIVSDNGITDLKNARHPLISRDAVVPTSIRLGDEFDTLVITGPNTGGKTVSIKTLGLLSAMAMSGLLIPADDGSRVSVFDNIFADIGDEQSIEQSLSTFSSHMTNIVDILKKTTDKTLVLIDELGAGTDPVEGAALAMSILEELKTKGAKIAATTHYAELKEYAIMADRVENACCEFDVKTLKPTYRLLIGVPGRSNAFAISKRLGIEDSIIQRANSLIEGNDDRFETIIEKLEEQRIIMEESKTKAFELERSARVLNEKAGRELERIEKIKDEETEKARGEALRIIEKAKREAFAFMDDLEKLKKEKKKAVDLSKLSSDAKLTIKSHLNEFDDISNPVDEKTNDENYVLPRELVVGDNVLIVSMGTNGTVTSIADKNGMIEVSAGIIKTRVPISDLRLGDKKKRAENKTRNVRSVTSKSDISVKTELDLRGMMSDEAILTLDRFIDIQLRSGVNVFTVIHGKGSGVLRKSVKEYLSKCKFVKEFRLGTFGEGEDGVTIVTLK